MCKAISSQAQTSILWSEATGTAGSIQNTCCATDLIGNIYMASSVNGNGLDWTIVSYRPDSVLRWTYSYDGSANANDVVSGIVVDSLFDVYVTGTTAESSDDITLIKLDSAGNQQYIKHYDKVSGQSDVATGISESGNYVYLCGYSNGTSSAYDYTVLKYSKAGVLQWSKHVNGTGNSNDYCSSIDVDANENVYVTGMAGVSGGTTDMLTLKISPTGVVSWNSYYGLKPGQNDFANAITADANGQIYITGQSFINSSNSDLVVVKYLASNGTQKWAAKFNGSYSGMDEGSAIIAASNNSIYVIGTTQTGSSNSDYVTIHYKANGGVDWMQQYDGSANGVDEGRVILEDGDDIVVSGRSMGPKNFDVTTISYAKQTGVVNWTIRYSSAYDEEEDVASLARDEMGNVIVGVYARSESTAYQAEVVKIHQKEKNDLAVENDLRNLAVGYAALVNDTVFKRIIWYNILRGFDDSIYVMYSEQLRALGDAEGVNATSRINTELSSANGWNYSFNWIEILNKQLWTGKGRVFSFFGIPKLYQFDKNGFITAEPNTAFAHLENDFPIGCATCPDQTLSASDIQGKAAWLFFINIPPFVYAPEKQYKPIVNCFAGKSLTYPIVCEICPVSPVNSYPVTTYGGTDHHEFGVQVDIGDAQNSICSSDMLDLNTTDWYAYSYMYPWNYGKITALPGVYWRTDPTYTDGSGYTVLTRSYGGHIIDNMSCHPDPNTSFQSSNSMTLCDPLPSEFHETGEHTPRYAIDLGGIYKVWSPVIPTLPPMYAYLTPFYGMTFLGAPDMNVFYGASNNNNTCGNGNFQFSEHYEIWNSIPGYFSDDLMGFTNPYDMYATSDLSALSNYWMDNAIVVGLGNLTGGVAQNVIEFYADNTGSTCDPLMLPDVVAEIGELDCLTGGYFEVAKAMNTTVAAGEDVIVHVEAQFSNGETIDQCQYITVNQNFSSVSAVFSVIRGDISPYSASPVNYKISIYSTTP